ncbi:hypothetical protein G7B40_021530 [Aetokthonos hydrillicola Thurmond2011]|jgi:hypothetical protein|uniref:Uncharacterized protein n=1 Tax=Aetokthonos hydrillicola Thurmond2011 TaxID=2712845 RepID=A0AAP5M9D3_9CYAN|nr:protein DpdG [Aetokthonos hydrillicola]MBO3457751.1 hypothetical protein [Aetokthonos hydrillicola CCALA 1050]MBW4589398.1 hypothetical protein [Aetokthonos hydrillicola CCALA 1050]MDR9897125.1 hypothetical protein [Aetokthonos hydrillicola Thurmond2011]
MSVLKEPVATPSRVRGIFRYLLQTKEKREKEEVLKKILSPDKLLKNATSPRLMLNDTINEVLKARLLIREDEEIAINPDLPENSQNPQLGDKLLPDTLAELFFASGNEDEEDFGRACAWYLAQEIYEAPGSWEEVEKQVHKQNVGHFLKMSNNALYGQMDDWMCYMGFAWGHSLGGKRVTVPDPTAYLKRNLQHLFNQEQEILMKDFITRLGQKCPLFETGRFREEVEAEIGRRQPNYLSTSTAFALFRLQDEEYIKLERKSDADLMILPGVNNQVDDNGRISHITWLGERS